MDNETLEKIIAALLGKNFKGEPNTGLISAMSPDTARRLIREAFSQTSDAPRR